MKLFPRTPHLAWSGHVGRDDLQVTEAESLAFLARMTVVQEKLDGANVSLRYADGHALLKNRDKSISHHPQFASASVARSSCGQATRHDPTRSGATALCAITSRQNEIAARLSQSFLTSHVPSDKPRIINAESP